VASIAFHKNCLVIKTLRLLMVMMEVSTTLEMSEKGIAA